jgi:glutamyl-tRNA synthetase
MSILPMLEAQEAWDNDALYEVLKTYSEREGVKAGFTIWPVRIALSGKAVTPAGATEIMEVLGKEESLARIREGIRKLTDAQ